MSTQRAIGVLLFLALAVNSAQFRIYVVTCSYSSRPFLCALELSYTVCTGSHVLYCSYRFYTEDAAEKNDGYRAAGYTIELRDTGRYGFLLPPDQVPHNKP